MMVNDNNTRHFYIEIDYSKRHMKHHFDRIPVQNLQDPISNVTKPHLSPACNSDRSILDLLWCAIAQNGTETSVTLFISNTQSHSSNEWETFKTRELPETWVHLILRFLAAITSLIPKLQLQSVKLSRSWAWISCNSSMLQVTTSPKPFRYKGWLLTSDMKIIMGTHSQMKSVIFFS